MHLRVLFFDQSGLIKKEALITKDILTASGDWTGGLDEGGGGGGWVRVRLMARARARAMARVRVRVRVRARVRFRGGGGIASCSSFLIKLQGEVRKDCY
jgi:hypothetical protein